MNGSTRVGSPASTRLMYAAPSFTEPKPAMLATKWTSCSGSYRTDSGEFSPVMAATRRTPGATFMGGGSSAWTPSVPSGVQPPAAARRINREAVARIEERIGPSARVSRGRGPPGESPEACQAGAEGRREHAARGAARREAAADATASPGTYRSPHPSGAASAARIPAAASYSGSAKTKISFLLSVSSLSAAPRSFPTTTARYWRPSTR